MGIGDLYYSATTGGIFMSESEIDLVAATEKGDGVSVLRMTDACRNWNGIQYQIGISGKNVGAKKLSMNVASIPPNGVARAHIHVDFEVMLYILEGHVRHEYGPGCETIVENHA